MADVTITDNVGLSADFKIRDNSPLAKAGLTQLVATGKELFANLGKPLDQTDIQSTSLGATVTSPDILSGDLAKLTLGVGMNCGLRILKSADKLLFPDDGFSPLIPIDSNQAWFGVEFDLLAAIKASASVNGIGLAFEGDAKVGCSTYSLFTQGTSVFPSLQNACDTGFQNYAISTSAAALRTQTPNTVNVTDASGSAAIKVTLSQPFTFSALASAVLPFELTTSVQPTATLSLAPSITIVGDFIIRAHKINTDLLRMGIYKKRGSTLAVTLTAAVGLAGDIGKDDVLGALLNAALPGIDVAKAGIIGDNATALNNVIKDSLSRTLSAQLNATCSAANTDEAAVLYEISLTGGNPESTDDALGHALRGDWTGLADLPNVRQLRNIAVETIEKKRAVSINFFGFFSATSVLDYLRSCTILVDESGQISFIDKADTKRISAASVPFASDTDKLRKALMEDFLCTATYKLLAGTLALDLSVVQSYFKYDADMPNAEMRQNVTLGVALGLIPAGSLDTTIRAYSSFHHALVNAIVRYDSAAVMNMFFKDPASRTSRSKAELEGIGREIMSIFLDPSDDTDEVRIALLGNDSAWAAMDDLGNVAAFSTIPFLSHLGTTQLGAVSADWVSIAWWSDAISLVGPALSDALGAAENSSSADPRLDDTFIHARRRLSNVLWAVSRATPTPHLCMVGARP